MRKLWNQYVRGGFEKRILSRGLALTLLPLALVAITTLIAQQLANSAAATGCFNLAIQDLNHMVQGVLCLGKSTQEEIAKSLQGAKVVLERAGTVEFQSAHPIIWKAKNQSTNQVTEISLPAMRTGGTVFAPVTEFSREAPIVDDVERLYKVTATVFQRMNTQGDMLRVATTVKNALGQRAIGTFIPAVNADGKPNPVISTVLKGKTYLGRAFVVNAWFIAAYQPMLDHNGTIIGMFYTGVPESDVRDKISRFFSAQVRSTDKTDVFLLHTAGQAKGVFVLSQDKSLDGNTSWDARDSRGKLFVREICAKALAAKPGEISEANYWSQGYSGLESRKMIARFTYFPEWDWVIGVEQPEADLLAAPNRISNIFRIADILLVLLCLAIGYFALRVWRTFVRELSSRISEVIGKLAESSVRLAGAAQAIGASSRSVEESADDLLRATQSQASASEETVAATETVTQTAHRNSKTAGEMLSLSSNTQGILEQAAGSLGAVDGAMQAINSSSSSVLGIVDSIDEICFATNIVAVNASIEAARAGEAGYTFAVIANEVRSLAGRCNEAAHATKGIVNGARVEMDRGSELVSRLVDDLKPVATSSDSIRALAAAISENSEHQSTSLGQVLKAMEEIQKTSAASAATAQKGADDATALLAQVGALNGSVSEIDKVIHILEGEFAG